MSEPRGAAELLVVGDVHRNWRASDQSFIERSGCAQAMFVGDLGDEDVEMAQMVASIEVPKAVILGNHDAWQSFGRRQLTPRLKEILDVLGDDHIAYQVRECYAAGVSIIGARPFSWGGKSLRSPEIYHTLYGVRTAAESAQKIVEAAQRAEHRDLVILAHNGPTGLSQEPHDIWGKDFGKPGGDWGDADLKKALADIAGLGLRVRAVIAGHMHDRLAFPRGGHRERFVRRGDTLFLNSAVVPRMRREPDGQELSYFLSVSVRAGEVVDVVELWVDNAARVRRRGRPKSLELPLHP